jgi:hypothetical protein
MVMRPNPIMVVRASERDGWWKLAHYDAFSYRITRWLPLPEPP